MLLSLGLAEPVQPSQSNANAESSQAVVAVDDTVVVAETAETKGEASGEPKASTSTWTLAEMLRYLPEDLAESDLAEKTQQAYENDEHAQTFTPLVIPFAMFTADYMKRLLSFLQWQVYEIGLKASVVDGAYSQVKVEMAALIGGGAKELALCVRSVSFIMNPRASTPAFCASFAPCASAFTSLTRQFARQLSQLVI